MGNDIHAPVVVQNVGPDGYQFLTKDFTKSRVTIETKLYKSRADLRKAAAKVGLPDDTLAFAKQPDEPGQACTIHMLDPAVWYEPEIVGHEYLHCVFGQWHIRNYAPN